MIVEAIHVALERVFTTLYLCLMFSDAILCEEQSLVDSHLSVPSRSCCIAGISRLTLGKKWSAPKEHASAE
jgi:hypothetical protein